MILQRLTSFTFFIALATLFPFEYVELHAKPAEIQSAKNLRQKIILAKKSTKTKHPSSPILVYNVRYHDHKKYTRVVLDLPTRAILKESKKGNLAKIELAKSRLSKRAFRQIHSRIFPKSIAINEGAKGTVVITLNLDALNKYELQTLRNPDRLVVDLFYSGNKLMVASKRKKTTGKTLNKSQKKKHAPKSPIVTRATKSSKKTPFVGDPLQPEPT